MVRGIRWALAVGLLVVLLGGCGGGDETSDAGLASEEWQPIAVTLDGVPNAENVGLFMALELGYFEDAGFNVGLRNPIAPNRPVQYVTERSVDFGISHEPQVALAQEKGAPIVAVGSLISEPTAAMIWLEKSKIEGIADLKGKTIGIYGLTFEREFLQSVLARAGLGLDDVKVKYLEYKTVPALARGRIDAIFGNSWNVEGAELESLGMKPVVTRVQKLGIPSYDELVVIARSDRLQKDPQLVSDFMSAVARGMAAAAEDPEAAAKAIVSRTEGLESGRKAVEASVEATLPLLSRDGYMDPAQAQGLVAWMDEEGMIKRAPPVSELLSNDYLPKPER